MGTKTNIHINLRDKSNFKKPDISAIGWHVPSLKLAYLLTANILIARGTG